MRRLTKATLLLISLWLQGVALYASNKLEGTYNLHVQAKDRYITAICIIEANDGGGTVGTIVNEFGLKILDFTHTGSKTKVMNVMKALDKWYIKRVLRKDLHIITTYYDEAADTASMKKEKSKRTLQISADGTFTLVNHRFKIVYNFSPINDNHGISQ